MAIQISPIIADRFGTSPAVKAPTPLTVAGIMKAQGATAGEANRFANLPSAPSMAQLQKSAGATAGEAQRFANIAANAAAKPTGTTATGSVVASPVSVTPSAPSAPSAPSGPSGSSSGTTRSEPTQEAAPKIDAAAALQALINQLLEVDYLGFQGEQAAELRRLQNLRNQLYGDAEFGTTGSVQRQQQLDTAARRRLAASRAVAGMLGGGAYAGTERGLGTIQRAEQDVALQELQRPFIEQTAADRLREFGLTFTPENRVFDLYNFNRPEDLMGGWAAETFAGRQAAARARLAALEQLRQRGITL